jgi:DNA polymerase III alpha subunit
MDNFIENFETYELPNLGLVRLPEVTISNEEKEKLGINKSCSNYEFLCFLAKRGFEEKKSLLPPEKLGEYSDRMKYELELFEELGFTDYVLLVWQIINKVKELNGFIDPGRGSCVGSFTFALLNITGVVDVIDKQLFFERFVNRTRSKKQIIDGVTYLQGDLIADADINISDRASIVNWLNEIYKGKICKMSAISTMTGKILIKDVYKTVNEVDEEEAKRVSDLIEKHFGIVEDIEKMPEKSSEFKKWAEDFPKTFKVALQLRDIIRGKSSHASGYFISYYDLDGFVPLDLNKEKEVVVAYDMRDACLFATKLDLLGLTQSQILQDFFSVVKEKPNWKDLDNDKVVYDALCSDNLLSYGLYQISANCMLKVVKKVKPKNIFELSDINAISRPGALDYLDGYVNNLQKCPHKLFENILKPTRNYCLYQEQMMQMLVAIGFTLEESETCRKIVGKKLIDKVKEWKNKIYNKCEENKFDKSIGDILWKILEDSAKYSFNRSHSMAVSYLGALTTWCKYKYPLEFYTSCLRMASKLPNPIEEISIIEKEAKIMGIKLLPPNIVESDLDFKIKNGNIVFGLASIKGISEKSIQKLLDFKNKYSNKFQIFSGANSAKIPLNIFSSLVFSGGLDNMLTESRQKTFLEFYCWNELTTTEKKYALELGKDYNYNLFEILKDLNEKIKNDKGKPVIKDSRRATLKKHVNPHWKLFQQNSKNIEVANYYFENQLLGFCYSTSLKKIFGKFCNDLIGIQEINQSLEGERVHFAAEVMEFKKGKSREKKTEYIKLKVKDDTGVIDVLMFNTAKHRSIDECEENNSRLPNKIGDLVIIRGQKKGDCVFARSISIQSTEIYKKISEIPKSET